MFPFLPVGLSLLGASIVGNTLADRKVNSARNAVMSAELERQQRYRAMADQALSKGMERWDAGHSASDIAQQQQRLEADNRAAIAPPDNGPATPGLTGDAPATVAKVYRDMLGEQQERGAQQAQRQAGVDSLQAWLQNQNIAMGRAGQDVARAANFAQGSSAVAPAEFDAANHKADRLKHWSDLLSALGFGSTMAGLWGLGASAHGLQTSPAGSYFEDLFDFEPLGKIS